MSWNRFLAVHTHLGVSQACHCECKADFLPVTVIKPAPPISTGMQPRYSSVDDAECNQGKVYPKKSDQEGWQSHEGPASGLAVVDSIVQLTLEMRAVALLFRTS